MFEPLGDLRDAIVKEKKPVKPKMKDVFEGVKESKKKPVVYKGKQGKGGKKKKKKRWRFVVREKPPF